MLELLDRRGQPLFAGVEFGFQRLERLPVGIQRIALGPEQFAMRLKLGASSAERFLVRVESGPGRFQTCPLFIEPGFPSDRTLLARGECFGPFPQRVEIVMVGRSLACQFGL